MTNTFHPTQIGFIPPPNPTGAPSDSKLILGQNPLVSWEAIGFGTGGRPDTLQQFQMYISTVSGNQIAKLTTPPLMATIMIDATSMYNVIASNPAAPTTGFYFAMREVSICVADNVGNTTEQKMMLLGSQPYPTGAS